MTKSENPVAEAIDGATGDWSMSGALNSLGSVANDVVTEIRQLTRGTSADESSDT